MNWLEELKQQLVESRKQVEELKTLISWGESIQKRDELLGLPRDSLMPDDMSLIKGFIAYPSEVRPASEFLAATAQYYFLVGLWRPTYNEAENLRTRLKELTSLVRTLRPQYGTEE